MAEVAEADQVPERISSIYTAYLEKPTEIVRALKTLRDQRAIMQLRFKGDEKTYTARVLDVHAKAFLLEDIQPRSGLQLMKERSTFSLSGRTQGLYVNSQSNQLRKVDEERGIPFFHVDIPKTILYQQRRRSARLRLPMRVTANGASVTLFRDSRQGDDSKKIVGRVIDLSAGGCRAEFDGPVHPPVDADEELKNCAINIPNLLDLSSKGAIRHFNYNKKTRTLTCGIELTEMHVTDRRRLEQFIQAISRVSERQSSD